MNRVRFLNRLFMEIVMNDRLRNPGWKRPADWPYEEDWDSPAWKERLRASHEKAMKLREKYGFICCPACNVGHTNKTICCRNCGHKAKTD